MKKSLSKLSAMAALFAIAATQAVNGANFTWVGTNGANLFWSTPNNWAPGGPPGVNDDALFFEPGATNNNVSATSVVTNNMTVHALRFGQTNVVFHNLFINPGVTLTVAGTSDNGYGQLGVDPAAAGISNVQSTLISGSWPHQGLATGIRVTNTISGSGALVINNTNNEMMVRYCQGSSSTARFSILDMSGLNTFTANLARIGVGYGQPGDTIRAMGVLLLAKTNILTLSGTNFADISDLIVGDNTGNNDGNSTTALLYLGNKNILNVDQILISGEKTPGQLLLNPAFASPTIVMRGSDGVGRVSKIRIGDESDAGQTSGPSLGTVNLLGGTSDILVDTIIVGKGQNGSGAPGNGMSGTLILGSGTLDVNTLELAYQFVNNQGGPVTGTATFSNTTVVVNNLLRLGHYAGSPTAAATRIATLNISGGSMTVRSNFLTEGTATIHVTNSVMALQQHPSVLASVMVLDGGTISNAAILKVTNTLTIVNGGQILGGNPVLDMGNSLATWDVSGAPGNGLTVSNALQGSGTYEGNLIQASGATINPGGSGLAGTLNIGAGASGGGNLTLNGGTLPFDLSNSGAGVNDQITVSGTLTLNGTNLVNLTALNGTLDKSTPYTLISSGTLSGGNPTYFTAVGAPAQSRYIFTFDTTTTPNSVLLRVGGTDPANLTWVGDGSANTWDLKNTANWNGGNQFFSLDAVTFDDTGSASPAVNLVGTLNPGSITVNNTSKNYTFSGAGGLTGAPLTKSGTGSLTFNNTSDNSFGGVVTVQGGTLTLGNSGMDTFVNGLTTVGGNVTFAGNSINNFVAGTSVAIGVGTSLTVANANANTFNGVPVEVDGSLTFTQAVDSVMDGVLTGTGTLTQTGSGALTLLGVNSGLSSVVQINSGTIKAGTTSALGSTGVTIANGGTLDLNGQNLGTTLPTVTVSGSGVGGNGAIVSTAGILITGTIGDGLNNVTMTGNTTIGGSGPWNTDPIRNFGLWGITGTLSTGGNNYSLTKVGLNQVSLDGTTVDSALGNIAVQQGLLDLAAGVNSLGNPASTITISAGAQVSFNATSTSFDKKFVLNGDGATASLLNYNGANTIIGSVTLNGSCVVGAVDPSRGVPVSLTLNGPIGGTGSLIKPSADTLILNGTNNYSGTTTLSGGTTLIDGINSGSGAVSVQSGATLEGSGAISGPVTASAGSTLESGDPNNSPQGTLTLNNSLMMNGATLMVNVNGAANNTVAVNGSLTLAGTSIIQIPVPAGTLTQGTTYDLITYTGTLTGNTNNLQVVNPPGYIFSVVDTATTPGKIRVHLDKTVNNLNWNGGAAGAATVWDTGVTTNWINQNGSTPSVFLAYDDVNFNDSASTNIVSLSGIIQPLSMTFGNSSITNIVNGSGALSGFGNMIVNGGGTVIIDNSGSNDFSGGVSIDNGTLQIGNGDGNGSLGLGPVTNNSTLFVTRTNLVMPNVFSGSGNLTKDSNGVVTLSGSSYSFNGPITVVRGTLQVDNSGALGEQNGNTVANVGATLDVGAPDAGANGLFVTNEQIQVGGQGVGNLGAIVNTTTNQQINALRFVTLSTNTTFGGTGRWDIRGSTTAMGTLSTGGSSYSLTKIGTNQISLVALNVDGSLSNIDIQQGMLGFETTTTSMGDPNNGTLTVHAGATLEFYNADGTQWNKNFVFTGDGVTPSVTNNSGNNTVIGPVTLNGNCVFGVGSTGLTFTATISGPGGLIKNGASVLYLSGNNTYTGNTAINAGTLALTGSASIASPVISLGGGTLDVSALNTPTLTLSSQTLSGNGAINGSLAAPAGTTVSPGTATAVGTLTVSNAVTLGGSTVMKLNGSGSDQLNSTVSLQFGGTLTVTNIGSAMTGGEVFQLFSAPSYSGSFTLNPLPALVPNLGWDTSQLGAGTLKVTGTVVQAVSPRIVSVSVAGGNIMFSGTNGSASGNYYVLDSTNVALPLANWTRIATNAFSSGNFSFTNAVNPNAPQEFYLIQVQ